MSGLTLRLKLIASACNAARRTPLALERYVEASACKKWYCRTRPGEEDGKVQHSAMDLDAHAADALL